MSCSDLSFKKDMYNCTVLGPAVPDFLTLGYFHTAYYDIFYLWGGKVLSFFFLFHNWKYKQYK